MLILRSVCVHLLLMLLLVMWPVSSPKAEWSTDQEAAIRRVEDYLNGIRTMVAEFTQIAPDGTVGYGRLFMSRPGKLRWQYEPPIPLLIVVNDGVLVYQDFELDQISHVPADDSLMALLAKNNLHLGRDVKLENAQVGKGTVRLSMRQPGKEDEGALTLVFDDNPVRMRKMEVLDATGQLTSVSFQKLDYGQILDKSLFHVNYQARKRKRN